MDLTLIWTIIAVIVAAIVGILTWLATNRQSHEKQNTSSSLGKLWNLAKRNPRQFALCLIGVLAVVIILWALKIPTVRDFLFTEVVVTVVTITAIALLILVLAITCIIFYRKRRLETIKRKQEREIEIAEHDQQIAELKEQLTKNEKLIEQLYENQESNLKRMNELTRETNELRDKLHKQTESNEALISAHSYLSTKYGLNIDSARFGLEASGAETKDVTEQIVLGLAEKGKVYVGLHLVGGRKNDPVKNTPKKLYVDYIQGTSFSKEFDENSTMSIEDLVQNFEGNELERPRDLGPTQKSKWIRK